MSYGWMGNLLRVNLTDRTYAIESSEKYFGYIGVIEASNGEKAFYSKKSLTENYARSLLEWYEVEIHENP